MIRRTIQMTSLLLLAAVCLVPARAARSAGFEQAWRALKQLSGTWEYTTVGRDHEPSVISYHVTSRGSVVWEEFLGSTPDEVREMATAYHLDVDELVATHYCGAGNQPRMKAISWDAEARILRFDFWDITHLADPEEYYTTDIELRFQGEDSAELRFRGIEDGAQGDWQIHQLRRLTRRVAERPEDETSG